MDDAIIQYLKNSHERLETQEKRWQQNTPPKRKYGLGIAHTMSSFTPRQKVTAKLRIRQILKVESFPLH